MRGNMYCIAVFLGLLAVSQAQTFTDAELALIFPEAQCDSTGLGYSLLFDPAAMDTALGNTVSSGFTAAVLKDDKSASVDCGSFTTGETCPDATTTCERFDVADYSCDAFVEDTITPADGDVSTLTIKVSKPAGAVVHTEVSMSDDFFFIISCTLHAYTGDATLDNKASITVDSPTDSTRTKASETLPDGSTVTAVVTARADAAVPAYTDLAADYTACSALAPATGPFARGTALAVNVYHDNSASEFKYMLIMSVVAKPADPADTATIAGDGSHAYNHVTGGCPEDPAAASSTTGPASDVGPQGLGVCQVINTAAFTFSALSDTPHAIRYDMNVRFCQDTADGRAACTPVCAKRKRRAVTGTNTTSTSSTTDHEDISVSISIKDQRSASPSPSDVDQHGANGGVCLSSGETVGVGVLILILLVVAAAVFIVGVMLMRRNRRGQEKGSYENGGFK